MLRKSIIAMLSKLLSVPIILVLALMLFFRGGEGASGLPSSHSGLSYGLLYLRQFLLGFSLYKYTFASFMPALKPSSTIAPKMSSTSIADFHKAGD
ncbi:MAG: hypothetical protein ACJAVZ_002428 [Afipia broomeae]|jgi:hypothetical protein|tara:strand:- start:2298 stop:2585 length:288 start_codon:yes stop_codon:yes gene_type:complete